MKIETPSQSKRSPLLAAFAAAAIALLPAAVTAQWQSAGTLNVPPYHYNFLAATPQGDLVAGTHNSAPAGQPPKDMPAVLIKNPMSGSPQVQELFFVSFESQRGFSGLASDADGNIYVSADTGEQATSFLAKFNSQGQVDRNFGQNGRILPGRRCLGIDIVGDYIFMAVDWGVVQVYDTKSGRFLNQTPPAQNNVFVRDVTVDPKSFRIFGVAQGGVVMWGFGAPWNANAYRFQEFSPKVTDPRAGEGISLDPIRRSVFVAPIPGQTLREVFGNRPIVQTPVASAQNNSHLADTALSFDGTTLFLSDMILRRIHVLRRQQGAAEIAAAAATPTTYAPVQSATGAATVAPPTWHRSYTDIVRQAREQRRPMVVYFRRPGLETCESFEKNVLLTNEFNRRAQNVFCVFEDASANQLLAYRFGVVRVPHLVILDPEGNQLKEFRGGIDSEQLFAAMDALK